MYKRLRNLLLIGVAIIAVAAVIRFRMSAPSRASAASVDSSAPTDTFVVKPGDVLVTVTASGPIQANQNASLSFSVTGKVVSIAVNEGDHVLKGQTLATLDNVTAMDSLLLAQAKLDALQLALHRLTDPPSQVDLNVAKAALSLAQAQLKTAQSSVDHIQSQIANINVGIAKTQLWAQELQRDADVQTKNNLNSVTGPFASQAKSQASQLPSDTAENAQIQAKDYGVSIAQANLDGAQNQTGNVGAIASAQAQVVSAQNALSKLLEGGDKQDIAGANANIQAAQSALDQAKSTLDKLNLVAPFDGVIAQMNLNVGQQTPPGAAAIILDTSAFYVDLPVDEVDIAKVALDQDATLKFDSLPGVVLNGKVTRISDTGTKAGSVVTYTVRVQIDPAGKPLLSSMTTTASIITGKVTGVLLIPNRYVRIDRSSGKAYATVRQADSSYKEVEIVLGLRNDTVTEVKSGLNAGDTLIPPQLQNNLSFGAPPPGGGPGA